MPAQGQPETILLPGHAPVQAAAEALLAHAGGDPHRLAQYIVLLPHAQAAPGLSAALVAAAGRETLLLPHFHTLQSLAARVPLPQPVLADSQRESLLYQALRQRGWFAPTQLWSVCSELLQLFDDLTRQGIALPDSLAAFEQQLAQAYAARANAPLRFEAALVHALWFAMTTPDGRLDPRSRYQLQLARLAQTARSPLAAIGLPPLAPAEAAFLQDWAGRQPVCVLQPALAQNDPASQALQAALLAPAASGDLGSRAADLRGRYARSPLAARLALLPAPSLEAHARGIAGCICEWLAAGCRSIGVVVLDRQVARRARALLERSQVLVEDESGWAFSTTSASTAMIRWLEALATGLAARHVLDLLKSPFAFYGWPLEHRRAAVSRLEQRLRQGGHTVGWPGRFLQDEADSACRDLLLRLQQAQGLLAGPARPLAAWLLQLRASLDVLGIIEGLQADAAGQQLLGLLDSLAQELADDGSPYDFAAFQQWLLRRLENECFIDDSLRSPVVFLPFSQARLRQFDALLLAGADAAHLPAAVTGEAFFNQAVRAQLGLPTRDQWRAQELEDLVLMLAAAPRAVISWQAQKNGEHHLASPWVEQLLAFHEAAWGARLPARTRLQQADPVAAAACPAPLSLPILPATRLPRELTVSAYQSLVTCPYQFFARHGLGLASLGELDGLMDKRDYGVYLHQVLAQFHRHYPVLAGINTGLLEAALVNQVETAFAGCAAEDYMSQGWKQRLLATIPAYLDWQRRWEAAGWRIETLEVKRQVMIPLAAGRSLTLSGRIDRIDRQVDGRRAVIDYKTQGVTALRQQAGQGKDVQLALYALLLEQPVDTALFLSLDRDRVEAVPLAGEVRLAAEAARADLKTQVEALYAGAPLPARPGPACQYCEMGGLCRKDYWPGNVEETGGGC